MPTTKPSSARYMDFIGGRRASATDPLISRPVSRPTRELEKKVATEKSLAVPAPRSLSSKPTSKPTPVSIKTTPKPASKPVVKPAPKSDPKIIKSPTKTTASTRPTTSTLTPSKPASTSKPAPKPSTPDNNAYSLGASAKSPVLPSYSVDKRPLSSSVPEKSSASSYEKLSFLGVNDSADKTPRKNVYEKKQKPEKPQKSSRPVKIIDDKEQKSGLPLPVIIILTILLGIATGAGVFFLLP